MKTEAKRRKRRRLWIDQGFKCSCCQKPITETEANLYNRRSRLNPKRSHGLRFMVACRPFCDSMSRGEEMTQPAEVLHQRSGRAPVEFYSATE